MRRRLFMSGLLAAAIATAVGVATVWPRGVRVSVTNRGPERLTDVVVHVTGNAYRLGTLEVGASQTVSVRSRGESHVELEFTHSAGERLRLNAGGYFEAGDEGSVEIELEGDEIVRNDQCIRSSPFGL